MKINKWWWKNLGSYGDIVQTIDFLPDKGELILLTAKNGQGKTTMLNALDMGLYGEILNKKGKRMSQKSIPNRINGNMECGVEFSTKEYDNITISRALSGGLKTTLHENGEPNTKAKKIQDRIDEIIGFDMESFKSFISINVNIFKDFINLTPEDKRTILDKLFNLQQINQLNKILKGLASKNLDSNNSIKREMDIYEKNIKSLKESIEEMLTKTQNNSDQKIEELKAQLISHKEIYTSLESKKTKYEEKFEQLNDEISKLNSKKQDINRDIKDIQKQIDLYDQGKCPTCGSDLSIMLDVKKDLVIRKEQTETILSEITESIAEYEETYKVGKQKYNKIVTDFNNLTELLSDIKSEINVLKSQSNTIDIEPIKNNIKKNEESKIEAESKFLETEKLKSVYELLSPMWGENGIKRDIIQDIIDPLNNFIKEDLEALKMVHGVELDNNFDAHIYEWNNEIDSDTLSTGEAKKINLVIMFAYIKTLRLKIDINILNLDEIFASVDIEGIEDILALMKKYANERGINIILVHHSELNRMFFDRVISVKKGAFSFIEDERY